MKIRACVICCLALGGSSIFSAGALAAPPGNDDFANAEQLDAAGADGSGTTTEATAESGEPAHAGRPAERSVWYSFTPATSAYYKVNVCPAAPPEQSYPAFQVAVYTGQSPATLVSIASDSSSGPSTRQGCYPAEPAQIDGFLAQAGTTYRIAVDSHVPGSAEGGWGFTYSLQRLAAPTNDAFSAASVLSNTGSDSRSGQTTKWATAQAGEPSHAGSPARHSVWYRFTPAATGYYGVRACPAAPPGLSYPTFQVAVYVGESLPTLTSVAGDSASGSSNRPGCFPAQPAEIPSFQAQEGTTYWIAVDSFVLGSDNGGWDFTLTLRRNAKALADQAAAGEDSGANTLAVLPNDEDPDSSGKAVASVTQPAHGNTTVTTNGEAVSYTPDDNYCGPDAFTYTLTSGSTATVSVTVTCQDDPPTAAGDAISVAEDSGPTPVPVLGNDPDIDDGEKLVTDVSDPAHGSAVVTGGGSGISYTPDPDYCGSDVFTYALNGGSSAEVAVSVACRGEPDSLAPQTSITSKILQVLRTGARRKRVRFTFISSEPGSVFVCKIDGKAFKPCRSGKAYRLLPGNHRFKVAAIDAAGNRDRSPAEKRFRVVRRSSRG